ncbi:hypothetical protein [Metallosphaera hakonensis]|uniref:hypothetical protein n=1 Tax=Metallosphaera hakonensis TaxID=79601 RepID=UPI0006CF3897|nr:hypothetical protein [Metallosphaera hakonensis]
MRQNRGLTSAIAILMLIIVVLVIAIPLITFFTNNQQAGSTKLALVNNYVYLKNLQVKQVEYGHPAIYYSNSSIEFFYTNGTFVPQSNLTITRILYFQGGVWLNLTYNYPIIVGAYKNLTLPSYVQGKPIIIVTSLGNVFFLTPKSSIGPYSTSARGGLIISAQISEVNQPIGVATNVTTNIDGIYRNYTTPVAFPNQSGTFIVKVPKYVFYERPNGSIVTGVFYNWIAGGQVKLNATTSSAVEVTLEGGSTSLTANYTPLTKYINLEIKVNAKNINKTKVSVDGQTYCVYNTKNISVPAGYVNVTIETLQYNYTGNEGKGIIYHYSYSSTNLSSAFTSPSFITFVNPASNGSILNIYYVNDYNFVEINTLYDYSNYYPNNVTDIYNLTNIIGIEKSGSNQISLWIIS